MQVSLCFLFIKLSPIAQQGLMGAPSLAQRQVRLNLSPASGGLFLTRQRS